MRKRNNKHSPALIGILLASARREQLRIYVQSTADGANALPSSRSYNVFWQKRRRAHTHTHTQTETETGSVHIHVNYQHLLHQETKKQGWDIDFQNTRPSPAAPPPASFFPSLSLFLSLFVFPRRTCRRNCCHPVVSQESRG